MMQNKWWGRAYDPHSSPGCSLVRQCWYGQWSWGGPVQFSHWPLLRQFYQVTDICCRDIFSPVLLSLSLCAVSPLILQPHTGIIVLGLFTLGITVPFCLYVLMLNTWVMVWHETVVVVPCSPRPFLTPPDIWRVQHSHWLMSPLIPVLQEYQWAAECQQRFSSWSIH